MKFGNLCIWCLAVLGKWQESAALRYVTLQAPEAVGRGQPLRMRCLYDLEGQELYTVKWYYGKHEFYRYTPQNVPPLKVFDIPGIEVIRAESDATRLTLARATRQAAGKYVCEVSADAPFFSTVQVEAVVKVVDFPPEAPLLWGVRPRYRPGQLLRAECVSRNALPPANLSFYVNGETLTPRQQWHRVEWSRNHLMTAFSKVQFKLLPEHFVGGHVRLRCTASVYNSYYESHERSALEERPRTTAPPPPATRGPLDVYHVGHVPRTTATSDAPGAAGRGLLVLLLLTGVLSKLSAA